MRIAHPIRCLISTAAAVQVSHYTCFTFSRNVLSRSLQRTGTPRRIVILSRNRCLFLSLSMADTQNISTISAEDEANYGFKREEMYTSNLAGSVDPYDRHVFLHYKSPDSWTSRVEENDLPKLLFSAIKAWKNDMTVKTKLTVCEGGESDGDVLIFPEMIRYKGLKDLDVDKFVEDVLVNGKPWASGVQEVLTGSYVFVCAHGSRDKRCGVCGPVLIAKLEQEIELRGLKDQIFVRPCSHVGGHKYAGNLIIYSPDSEGKIMGHWYGYVTSDDVPELLDQHIGKGQIIRRLWRGQMGPSVEEAEKVEEQKVPNGEDVEQKKHEESSSLKSKVAAAGCCQGANGFTCCRDGSLEEGRKKELGSFATWIRSLDQSDVLTAAAVVGAVATVAVAYSLYRRSG